jgi:hypothetical protein
MVNDDDQPQSPEEMEAAAALAAALDGEGPPRAARHMPELEAASSIAAAAGREAPLGELRALGLARAAVTESVRRRAARQRRRRWLWTSGAVAAAALVLILVSVRGDRALPPRLCSRPAGRLVPGPFPSEQSAAQRLDLVTADRLVAWRELRLAARAQ